MEYFLNNFNDFDSRIVIFGMSCVGKTTFAQSISTHKYLCFDQMFQWHLIESFGLSIEANLQYIKTICESSVGPFVLDGWHLGDKIGRCLPDAASVYVLWAPYEKIISQYRIPVIDPEEFRSMYKKWYCEIDFDILPKVRYFQNDGEFIEISRESFYLLRT
jgi:GTPase SAR1 family protein